MRGWMRALTFLGVICAGLPGCSSGNGTREIHGSVTLDGQAVEKGNIRFIPTDGKGARAEVFIKDGTYTASLPPGNYKVEIYSPQSKGIMTNRPPGPGAKAKLEVETIPAKYNAESQLTVDVKPDVDEVPPFDLKSK